MKRKRSRWEPDDSSQAQQPLDASQLPATMTDAEKSAYLLRVQLAAVNQKLTDLMNPLKVWF